MSNPAGPSGPALPRDVTTTPTVLVSASDAPPTGIQRRRPARVRPDYAATSRMARSALIADAVCVFTDPRLMPMTEAICASLISP
jgi:hypothetical protein